MNFKLTPLSKYPILAIPYVTFNLLGQKTKQIYLQQNTMLLPKIFTATTFFSYPVQFRMILLTFLIPSASKDFPFSIYVSILTSTSDKMFC